MALLGTLMGSAKQLAQNAILEKLEARGAGPDHPLLAMLREAFKELTPEKRKELFEVFAKMFAEYQTQPNFDFDAIWKNLASQRVIQDLAVAMSKRLVSSVIPADH